MASTKAATKARNKIDKAMKESVLQKIDKAIKDRDDKCELAKQRLVEHIKVCSEKYGTATGIINALETYRNVTGESKEEDIKAAKRLAVNMMNEVSNVAKKAEELSADEMGTLCDESYDKDFTLKKETPTPEALAFELLRLNMCQVIGPNASDIEDFHKRATEEIDEMRDGLKS